MLIRTVTSKLDFRRSLRYISDAPDTPTDEKIFDSPQVIDFNSNFESNRSIDSIELYV